MKTVNMDLKEVATNLEEVVNRLRLDRTYGLLMSGDTVVAELIPLNCDEVPRCQAPDEWVGPREERCPFTGATVVAARPGVRMVTSEEIYELLRGTCE